MYVHFLNDCATFSREIHISSSCYASLQECCLRSEHKNTLIGRAFYYQNSLGRKYLFFYNLPTRVSLFRAYDATTNRLAKLLVCCDLFSWKLFWDKLVSEAISTFIFVYMALAVLFTKMRVASQGIVWSWFTCSKDF